VGDPAVSAVVVNYRSGEHLDTCLRALLAEDDGLLARVVVVDNSPGDPSYRAAERAASADPRVTLVRAVENLGLAGGVNLALDHVETRYLAVLNPDVTVRPGWLSPLVEALDSDGEAAAACPLIVIEGSGRINSAGQQVHVTGLGFNHLLGRPPEAAGQRPHTVGGLHGAAFLIRTDTLRRLGGWDTTGFLYHEDVALSWDLLLSGHDMLVVPTSMVDHDYHLTMYPEKLHLLERNRWALLLSHLRWFRLILLVPGLVVVEVLVWGLCLLRGPRFLAAKASSYRWLARNRRPIRNWRQQVMSRPRYDESALRQMTVWSIPLGQMVGLGRERGASARVPPGGLPT
jgi:hypothetical protein